MCRHVPTYKIYTFSVIPLLTGVMKVQTPNIDCIKNHGIANTNERRVQDNVYFAADITSQSVCTSWHSLVTSLLWKHMGYVMAREMKDTFLLI